MAEKIQSKRVTVFRLFLVLVAVAAANAIDLKLPNVGGAVTVPPRSISVGGALADEGSPARATIETDQDTGAWRILKSDGDAAVRSRNAAWTSPEQGAEIQPATQVKTGRDGRLVLSKGGDRIVMSPGAVIEIEERGPGRLADGVRQVSGSVQYDLNRAHTPEPDGFFIKAIRVLFSTKQPESRFEVDTPHLIAGVKGTRFSVDVTRDDTRVSVSSGVVNVRSRRGQAGEDIFASQTARVAANQVDVQVTGEPGANSVQVEDETGDASGGGASYAAAAYVVIALVIIVAAAIAIASVIVAAARWAIGAISIRRPAREKGRQAGDEK